MELPAALEDRAITVPSPPPQSCRRRKRPIPDENVFDDEGFASAEGGEGGGGATPAFDGLICPPPAPSCRGHKRRHSETVDNDNNSPARVLEGLFLGGSEVLQSPEWFVREGITHCLSICNVGPHEKTPLQGKLQVKCADSPFTDLQQHFIALLTFIHESRCSGGKVLVHCSAGISRSATTVIAYLMSHLGMGFEDALQYTITVRASTCPNPGFIEQLKEFGKNGRRDVLAKELLKIDKDGQLRSKDLAHVSQLRRQDDDHQSSRAVKRLRISLQHETETGDGSGGGGGGGSEQELRAPSPPCNLPRASREESQRLRQELEDLECERDELFGSFDEPHVEGQPIDGLNDDAADDDDDDDDNDNDDDDDDDDESDSASSADDEDGGRDGGSADGRGNDNRGGESLEVFEVAVEGNDDDDYDGDGDENGINHVKTDADTNDGVNGGGEDGTASSSHNGIEVKAMGEAVLVAVTPSDDVIVQPKGDEVIQKVTTADKRNF